MKLRTITHLMPDHPTTRPPDHPTTRQESPFTLDPAVIPSRFLPRPQPLAAGRVHKSGITDPIIDYKNTKPEPGEDLSVTMIPRGPARHRNGPRKITPENVADFVPVFRTIPSFKEKRL